MKLRESDDVKAVAVGEQQLSDLRYSVSGNNSASSS